jgi:hypothetical protein
VSADAHGNQPVVGPGYPVPREFFIRAWYDERASLRVRDTPVAFDAQTRVTVRADDDDVGFVLRFTLRVAVVRGEPP